MKEGEIMKNKRGSSDLITWIVAFVLIFFIMVIFLGLIILASPNIGKAKIEIKEEVYDGDYARSASLINFFKAHEKGFSDWADDEAFLTAFDLEGVSRENQLLEDYPIQSSDIERLKLKQDIIEGYVKSYFLANNISEGYLYIYSNNKRLVCQKIGEEYGCNPPKIANAGEDALPLVDSVVSYEDEEKIKVRFFILSKGGNLIGVKYYDENDK